MLAATAPGRQGSPSALCDLDTPTPGHIRTMPVSPSASSAPLHHADLPLTPRRPSHSALTAPCAGTPPASVGAATLEPVTRSRGLPAGSLRSDVEAFHQRPRAVGPDWALPPHYLTLYSPKDSRHRCRGLRPGGRARPGSR